MAASADAYGGWLCTTTAASDRRRCSSVWMCTAGVTSHSPSTTAPSASMVRRSLARTSPHHRPHGFTRKWSPCCHGDVAGHVLAPADVVEVAERDRELLRGCELDAGTGHRARRPRREPSAGVPVRHVHPLARTGRAARSVPADRSSVTEGSAAPTAGVTRSHGTPHRHPRRPRHRRPRALHREALTRVSGAER